MTNKIKLLPEQVANQIAAGEVVDRPASVVKELMENSLDAGARRITVLLEQGGKRLIRVSDDGEGMSRDDALLSLERHATSKIRRSADLFAIHTLGFRGEALPSIASVSEMSLATREAASPSGVKIQIEAGVIKSVSEVGAPPGTEIAVRRLFYNVPARRKFLKSVDTELGHITALCSNMALARPDLHFTLIHHGRPVFDLPASSDLGNRLRHALGADALRQLLPVNRSFPEVGDGGPLAIHGYVSVPSYSRSSTRSLHIFVNQRFVRDRLINHAVFEAYRTLLPKGRYPLVVLFLELPPDAVDVNVHPAKHEIRFRDQAAVHQAVVDALQDALRVADRAGAEIPAHRVPGLPARGALGKSPAPDEMRRGVADALRRYREKVDREGPIQSVAGWEDRAPVRPAGFERPEPIAAAPVPAPPSGPPETEALRERVELNFSELRVIGQAGGTYLLAEAPDALVIIDQHAAHERIMFERLRSEFKNAAVARQALLFPLTLDLTFAEARRVEAHLETLLRLGVEVEPFGGGTVVVKSMPALLAEDDPGRLLLEIVDGLGESRDGALLMDRLDDIFALLACHSVVRAHKVMSVTEIQALLAAMDEPSFPGHCPHGRDVVVKIRFRDLEKWFGR